MEYNYLVEKTYEYLHKNAIKNVIIGLSGGIDSTFSAMVLSDIWVQHPNEFNVIGISLPSRTNSHEEMTTAAEVGKVFCNMFQVDNIDKIVDQFIIISDQYGAQRNNSLGNLKARIRTTLLYNEANMLENSIVIDNTNLTERTLGYYAVNGDGGDVSIIGNLWKHEIYELALIQFEKLKATNQTALYEALYKSISLEPSNGEGVNDMDYIAPGNNYADVDHIIDAYLNIIKPYWNIINEPVDPQDKDFSLKIQAIYTYRELKEKYAYNVDKVIKMCENSEYKRKRYPVIIK